MYRIRPTRRPSVAAIALALFVAGCSESRAEAPREVAVVGSDYAFSMPDTLPSGPTRLAFRNDGRVDHELLFAALKPGVTLADALAANAAGGDTDEFLEAGASVLYAGPGQHSTAELLVDLKPGRKYAVVCLMRDTEEAAPHAAMGMVKEVTVQ